MSNVYMVLMVQRLAWQRYWGPLIWDWIPYVLSPAMQQQGKTVKGEIGIHFQHWFKDFPWPICCNSNRDEFQGHGEQWHRQMVLLKFCVRYGKSGNICFESQTHPQTQELPFLKVINKRYKIRDRSFYEYSKLSMWVQVRALIRLTQYQAISYFSYD